MNKEKDEGRMDGMKEEEEERGKSLETEGRKERRRGREDSKMNAGWREEGIREGREL